MFAQLQALLTESTQSLQSNPSETNTERVLLDVLERASALLEQNVVVPALPTPKGGVRNAVFNVFARTGRLLGRNSPNAVIADCAHRVAELKDSGLDYPRLRGRHQATTPEKWIDDNVVPTLDLDQKEYAKHLRVYSEWEDFYGIWKTRMSKLSRLAVGTGRKKTE